MYNYDGFKLSESTPTTDDGEHLSTAIQSPHLYTYECLKEKAAAGLGDEGLRIYETLQRAGAKNQYTHFVSARFTTAMTDLFAAQSACRQTRHKINKYIFRRRPSSLRFLFIIEKDAALWKGLPAYHFHYLITSQEIKSTQPRKLPKAIRFTIQNRTNEVLRYQKLNYIPRNQICGPDEKQRLITDPFHIMLFLKTKRTRIYTSPSQPRVGNPVVRNVFDQPCLGDYVLKALRVSPDNLYIDYENSDVNFDYC